MNKFIADKIAFSRIISEENRYLRSLLKQGNRDFNVFIIIIYIKNCTSLSSIYTLASYVEIKRQNGLQQTQNLVM